MSAVLFINSTFLAFARQFGILAFLALGLIDQSVIPVPGSLDALVILFVASKPELWWYYPLLATAGATLGAYVTFRLARKGGREALDKKLGKNRVENAHRVFSRYGFWSVFIGTILPPPVPIVPFLAVAGVMEYPTYRFLLANASGRMLRFSIVAYITKVYGKSIFQFFSRYYKPAFYSLIGLTVVGGVVGLSFYLRYRRNRKSKKAPVPEHKAA
jgi:membrane protein DedA with SNARE-associated domain